jgi:hypothetical protein
MVMKNLSQRSFSRSSLAFCAARVLTPLAVLLAAGLSTEVSAQVDSRFTYQGELKDAGNPVSGVYDLRFRLYNAQVGPAQVGPQVTVPGVAIVDGLFNAEVNFGPGVFTGAQLWVEIDSRPAGGGAYVTLAPRQRLNATPFSAYALAANTASSATTATTATTANNALNLNSQPPAFYTNATNLNAGTVPSARLTGAYSNALTLSNVGNVFFGNGANLTGINATNISAGTLSDALLSANIARRNQANTFSTANTFNALSTFNTNILAIDANGGEALNIDANSVAAGSILTTGLRLNVDANTTHYGVYSLADGVGTGAGFTYYAWNESPGGHGFRAFMPDAAAGINYGISISNASTQGYGAQIINTATTGTTYGVYAENNSPDGYGLFALHDASTGTGPAIFGRTDSTSAAAYAIHGLVNTTAGGGSSAAIRGEHLTTTGSGIGVFGSHAGSGYGVYGTVVDGRGVYGRASGAGEGVYGYSVGGYGGYFDTGVAGGAALYVVGTASVGVITIRGGADLAEKFEFNCQTTEILPGMVVMIDDEHDGGMELATGAYNKRVAGVISGAKELAAGMILGDFDGGKNPHAVALTGRVWTYVDASEKAVESGDLLTTSNTPGYAMPVVDSSRAHGATIGKAMTKLEMGQKGMVLVLVNLQ